MHLDLWNKAAAGIGIIISIFLVRCSNRGCGMVRVSYIYVQARNTAGRHPDKIRRSLGRQEPLGEVAVQQQRGCWWCVVQKAMEWEEITLQLWDRHCCPAGHRA